MELYLNDCTPTTIHFKSRTAMIAILFFFLSEPGIAKFGVIQYNRVSVDIEDQISILNQIYLVLMHRRLFN